MGVVTYKLGECGVLSPAVDAGQVAAAEAAAAAAAAVAASVAAAAAAAVMVAAPLLLLPMPRKDLRDFMWVF